MGIEKSKVLLALDLYYMLSQYSHQLTENRTFQTLSLI